jgi:hypothetical protein
MDRVSSLQSLFIIGVSALGRKLLVLSSVEVIKRPGYSISGRELIRIDEWFEEPPPDDLKSFLRTGWSP